MPVLILIKERKGSWGSGEDLGEVLGEETILGYLLYLKNLFSKKEKSQFQKCQCSFTMQPIVNQLVFFLLNYKVLKICLHSKHLLDI